MLPTYYKYWGKASRGFADDEICHLLPYHCLDVAAVGQILADRLGVSKHIAEKLKCQEKNIVPIIVFLCAVHDIGKFSDGFQNQIPELARSLRGKGLHAAYQEKHWSLGHRFWREYAGRVFSSDQNTILDHLDAWFSASSGHHGRPPSNAINAYFDTRIFPVDDAIDFI
ncbi:MAG: CRISPR-associated endonuclease Cas3'' [Candidatus Omnitrophica bacterium]|nr:CRISPR-associated endonuclease Cas3'' [Candidatus Omnitrophota bacterium]